MPKVNAVAKKIIANVEKVIIGKRQEVILALMSTFAIIFLATALTFGIPTLSV